jgi:hypothetical protein
MGEPAGSKSLSTFLEQEHRSANMKTDSALKLVFLIFAPLQRARPDASRAIERVTYRTRNATLSSGSQLFAVIRFRYRRWQPQAERRAGSDDGIELHRSIMPLHDLIGLRQADSASTFVALGGEV